MVFTIQQGEAGGLLLAFDQASGQTASKVRAAVLTALQVGGAMNVSQLKRDIGGRGASVNAALEQLQREGVIRMGTGQRGSKVYELLRPIPE